MKWSAAQYSRFIDDRTRPARDLLSAIPLVSPRRVVDIGCGPGNSTDLLYERYPDADVSGIDSDEDMLRTARKALPACRFEHVGVEDWRAVDAPDLIFANASLQWVDNHETLFPQLIDTLASGGFLAVQMPDNLQEPVHIALREVAQSPRWRDRLASAAGQRKPLVQPPILYRLLRPACRKVDIWRTVYHLELEGGIDGIVEWFRGAGMRPYLAALDPDDQAVFIANWRELLIPHYPVYDRRVLLPFPRYFFVAEKKTVS